jgi:hypothetical protein
MPNGASPFCRRSSYAPVSLTLMTRAGSTTPGLSASRRSRKNKPVVIDGSLNDRMGRTPDLPFCAVELAHFSMSVSLMGLPVLESPERVFVIFNLKCCILEACMRYEKQLTNLISCQTRPRTSVLEPSTMSAPWIPTRCMPCCFASSTP